ncbi:hypothetical protein PR048_005991 [Dryococelus australis]|uniref:Uncharacterized protein n=1 Tax=Dryococelus australis TaxID=614101 RepID=A0ABQ9I9R0_9NEOP|nr:hypothetical protein PR048_005991 [Dryococelus australis]
MILDDAFMTRRGRHGLPTVLGVRRSSHVLQNVDTCSLRLPFFTADHAARSESRQSSIHELQLKKSRPRGPSHLTTAKAANWKSILQQTRENTTTRVTQCRTAEYDIACPALKLICRRHPVACLLSHLPARRRLATRVLSAISKRSHAAERFRDDMCNVSRTDFTFQLVPGTDRTLARRYSIHGSREDDKESERLLDTRRVRVGVNTKEMREAGWLSYFRAHTCPPDQGRPRVRTRSDMWSEKSRENSQLYSESRVRPERLRIADFEAATIVCDFSEERGSSRCISSYRRVYCDCAESVVCFQDSSGECKLRLIGNTARASHASKLASLVSNCAGARFANQRLVIYSPAGSSLSQHAVARASHSQSQSGHADVTRNRRTIRLAVSVSARKSIDMKFKQFLQTPAYKEVSTQHELVNSVPQRMVATTPDTRNRANWVRFQDFRKGNLAGRCLWSAGFLGDLPFTPPLHSGAAPYSLQSPSSALKTSLLRATQISSLTHSFKS